MTTKNPENNSRLRVEYVPIDSLAPAPYNPRTISDDALARLKRGVEEFGLVDPIIVRAEDNLVIGGHQRLKVLRDLQWSEVPVVLVSGLDDNRTAALNILLNNPNAQGEWDNQRLRDILSELDATGFDATLTAFDSAELQDLLAWDGQPEEEYTNKIDSPIYTPKGDCPSVTELFDHEKTSRLLAEIDAAELNDAVPPDIADFLRLAAERHTVFNFRQIAEYYCHADATIQDLMEKSGLVIIDFKKAIEYGFVHMTEQLSALADLEEQEA